MLGEFLVRCSTRREQAKSLLPEITSFTTATLPPIGGGEIREDLALDLTVTEQASDVERLFIAMNGLRPVALSIMGESEVGKRQAFASAIAEQLKDAKRLRVTHDRFLMLTTIPICATQRIEL